MRVSPRLRPQIHQTVTVGPLSLCVGIGFGVNARYAGVIRVTAGVCVSYYINTEDREGDEDLYLFLC